MCGIAGWLDFDHNLIGQTDAIRAMTQTMACRGPDDEGMWVTSQVALGHRRLAVIDLAGGRQPMPADEEGHRLAVLTYSGEVYNFRELRADLASRGHQFRTRSDTEVVLRSYLEWGEDAVDRLNGMYAFALWDARREELLLVRDRLGVKPLYFYPLPSGVLFGSEPKAILANPLAERTVDLDGLREMLALAKTPERTVYRGMYELRPGHLLRVGRNGLRKRRYWGLTAQEHRDDLPTTVRTVRELLEDIVARQLVADVPLCAQLSGGLDSSAITALAARSLHEQGARLRSFTVDFAGSRENFEPNLIADTIDLPYAREVAQHTGTDAAEIVLDSADLADPSTRSAVLRAMDLPSGSGDFNVSLYLLFRAVRERSTVALSGESAEELFGGYPWMFSPATLVADTFPWLAFLRHDQVVSALFDPALLAQLDLSGYRTQRYREACAETPRLSGEDRQEHRMREMSYLHLTRFLPGMLDRKDRMSMAVGLEVRVPYCDHRLVEYAFNVPWRLKTFDGNEKSLLRAATQDLLPRSVVERRKAVYPTTQDPAYEQAVRTEFGDVVNCRDAPVQQLLDAGAAGRLLAEPVRPVSTAIDRAGMELVIQLNAWLAGYGIRLDA
jgi:asparagine synthase (glutamine-hydrolysing)